MREPTEIAVQRLQPGGKKKSVKKYSYVAVICRKGGCEVKAIRFNWYENKEKVLRQLESEHPGWNRKGVWRLYEDDFKEG